MSVIPISLLYFFFSKSAIVLWCIVKLWMGNRVSNVFQIYLITNLPLCSHPLLLVEYIIKHILITYTSNTGLTECVCLKNGHTFIYRIKSNGRRVGQ